MAQPTRNDVHANRPLTNVSVAYVARQDIYIANKVFPVVPVDHASDVYFTYTKNDWFRDEAQRRAPATESVGSGYNVNQATYNCDVYAIHKDVPDQVRQNEDNAFNSDRDATEFVTQRLLLRQERQWAADFFTTGVWANDVTPTNLWSNYGTSDPITDIKTGVRAVLSTTGFKPNTLVLGYDAYIQLIDHPDIIDRYKYTSSDGIETGALARLFGVERVFVASAVYATNVENETEAYAFVHGKHAWLGYVAPRPSLLTPSAGYTFSWKGASYGMGGNIGIKKFRMEPIAADRVEGQIAFDNKAVATDMGYFFNGAVA